MDAPSDPEDDEDVDGAEMIDLDDEDNQQTDRSTLGGTNSTSNNNLSGEHMLSQTDSLLGSTD